jgi:hypothetical protein
VLGVAEEAIRVTLAGGTARGPAGDEEPEGNCPSATAFSRGGVLCEGAGMGEGVCHYFKRR